MKSSSETELKPYMHKVKGQYLALPVKMISDNRTVKDSLPEIMELLPVKKGRSLGYMELSTGQIQYSKVYLHGIPNHLSLLQYQQINGIHIHPDGSPIKING